MNRLMECRPYRLREELEEVLSPWPVNVQPTRTLSELEVTKHGRHLPHAVPAAFSEEAQLQRYHRLPLRTTRLLEQDLEAEGPDVYKNEAIEDGMKVLENDDILPPSDLFKEILEVDEEPDDTYAMLDTENEARYRFDAFLKRMRLHYSDYVPTGDEIKYERPQYELPPMRRDKKPPVPYYDKRCDDKRKMIPMVYEAPPYPEYWLLEYWNNKKPKVPEGKEPDLIVDQL